MRKIDIPLQIDHLRTLGADFAALHTTVTALDSLPGSDALHQLTPRILDIHELVGRTLVRLSVLDNSQYTAVPGSRASLNALLSVLEAASTAASALSAAVAANPLDATGFDGGPRNDDTAERQARHAKAMSILAKNLSRAARQLALCATGCRYTASNITRSLKEHPEHQPRLPQLTAAQYAVLDKVARGGARRYDRGRGKGMSVKAKDGSTVHPTPFGVLEEHRLVRIDTRSSAFAGQDITVTAAGELALATQQPGGPQPAAPAAGPVIGKAGGRRR
ncbi:hypothetical protein [Streptomyces sp. CC208A]|uniref:hypothetical protein n=1 Tax=Streptomyces sp. CC208A TaxID=3044573 RepID=UPI0024A82AEC|nr:hypothetical protein [Streptomyces sp. CC208A]